MDADYTSTLFTDFYNTQAEPCAVQFSFLSILIVDSGGGDPRRLGVMELQLRLLNGMVSNLHVLTPSSALLVMDKGLKPVSRTLRQNFSPDFFGKQAPYPQTQ